MLPPSGGEERDTYSSKRNKGFFFYAAPPLNTQQAVNETHKINKPIRSQFNLEHHVFNFFSDGGSSSSGSDPKRVRFPVLEPVEFESGSAPSEDSGRVESTQLSS